jgi:hypothetical protein
MTVTHVSAAPDGATGARTVPYLEWGPIFAGAIAAAAISFLLLSFATAVGLSLTSPWPSSGARLWVVALAVGWFAIAVQIASFAAGGYLAGRMRRPWLESPGESEFRDSVHGFMVWAVGIVFGALLLGIASGSALGTATQSAATVAGGAAAGATNALSTTPSDYATDLLLRQEPSTGAASTAPTGAPAGVTQAPPVGTPSASTRDQNDQALRTETNRIFAATIRNQAFSERDRTYLVRVVQSRTGLPEAEAQKRVDAATNEARDLEIKAREAADKARKAAVITGFITAASLLISLAVACYAAGIGGRHRNESRTPLFYGHRFW